jgi:hypothetical protein
MIDASLGPPPASPGGGWREKLAAWARANLANFRRHSWVIETTIHRVPVGPNWLAWLESALRSMSDVGLSAREKIAVVFLVDGHARAAAEISLGVTGTPQWAEDFGRVIERIGGEARFQRWRRLRRAAASTSLPTARRRPSNSGCSGSSTASTRSSVGAQPARGAAAPSHVATPRDGTDAARAYCSADTCT